MVDLLSLIDLLKEKKVVQYPVICFAGETYQLIFFSLFIKKVATFLGKQLNKIQFESYEPTSISQLIEISFLGNSLLYWFGDIESYFAAKTKSFFFPFN